MTTGQLIKAARKSANMTQAELADKLGIPYQSVSQWERDTRNPKYGTLKRIAAALNTPIHSLIPSEPGILDSLLPDGLHGLAPDELKVDEDTLCYMLDQMIDVEQINPELYQRLKTVLYFLAVSSGLEHVLVYYGSIYDDDEIDLSSPKARAIIEKIKSDMQKAPQFKKMSDAEQYRAGFLKFHSDEDRIAHFYRLLNEDGKLAAGVCFFKHLDKDTWGEVADYVMGLCENPLYQRTDISQSAQVPKGDVETAPQPPAEVEEGKDTGPDQEAPETTENKESG